MSDLISREYVEKIILSEVVDLHDGTEEWRIYVNDTCENILNKVHNAPTVEPQKVVTIPHELIEKLVLCVVDTVENIDWDKAIEAYRERPTGEWNKCFDKNDYFIGYKCSKCENICKGILNFCPNCGAYMRSKS